jgi:hypothetical protein
MSLFGSSRCGSNRARFGLSPSQSIAARPRSLEIMVNSPTGGIRFLRVVSHVSSPFTVKRRRMRAAGARVGSVRERYLSQATTNRPRRSTVEA